MLVIDDDSLMLEHIRSVLNSLNMESHLASGAAQALMMLDNEYCSTDLILCDLNMPDMDGIEFLRQLTARRYQGSIVLISDVDKRICS